LIAFYLFGVFALFGVVLKALILAQVSTRTRITNAFVVLTLLFILLNAFEFLGYWTFESNAALAYVFIDGLMLSLIFIPPAAIHFIARSIGNRAALYSVPVLMLWAAALMALLINGTLINGYQHVGYTIVSQPGPAYGLFQAYVFAGVIVAVAALLWGLLGKDREIHQRSRILLLAFAPIFLVAFGVNLFKLAGFNASTAILMPLASTFFIWVLLYLARDEVITFRLKWRQFWFLVRQLRKVAFSNHSYANEDYLEFMEKEQLAALLEITDGRQAEVARILGSSPATISRRVARFGLNKADKSRPEPAISKTPAA
jgi:hypothetical protein